MTGNSMCSVGAVERQTMTSLEIAEVTGKQHKDVLRAIRKMEAAWVKVTERKFALSEYSDPTGRSLPVFVLTKRECLYVATKFNDEARARLVVRWEELERGRLGGAPAPSRGAGGGPEADASGAVAAGSGGGWVRLLRTMSEWEWWGREPHRSLFLWLLVRAEVTDRMVAGVLVRRGSVLTTWSEMKGAVGCTTGSLSRALKDMSLSGDVASRTDGRRSVVTVCRYEYWVGGGVVAPAAVAGATYKVSELARCWGMKAAELNLRLQELGVQRKCDDGTWCLCEGYAGRGYTVLKECAGDDGGVVRYTVWTEAGRRFIAGLLGRRVTAVGVAGGGAVALLPGRAMEEGGGV